MIRTGESTAVVSALFSDLSPSVLTWLERTVFSDEDGNILIYRQISSEDGSQNKRDASYRNSAKGMGSLLINVHGQHENQSLLYENTHLPYLDSFVT